MFFGPVAIPFGAGANVVDVVAAEWPWPVPVAALTLLQHIHNYSICITVHFRWHLLRSQSTVVRVARSNYVLASANTKTN